MKKPVLFFACLFFCSFLSAGYGQNPKAGNATEPNFQDLLGVEAGHFWDFGRITEGEVVKHDFTVKNNFAAAVKIKDVSTSCGCTASEIKNKELALGEETLLTVTFNSADYEGETRQFIFVSFDDPQQSVIRYMIKAFVGKK